MQHMPILEADLNYLRKIRFVEFPTSPNRHRSITDEEFDHIFRTCDALWLHSGDPKDPHAELTSGKCSNGFVDTLRVLRYTALCKLMAEQLKRRMIQEMAKIAPPSFLDLKSDFTFDWAIGSDHASAVFAYEIVRNWECQYDFTEKGDGKTQVWQRFLIQPNEVVLQIEELVTTLKTLTEVRKGIRAGTPTPVKFAPFVFALVHRSHEYEFEGTPIHYVRHYDINSWDQKDCPLCAAGSERIKPKANWAKLTGKAK